MKERTFIVYVRDIGKTFWAYKTDCLTEAEATSMALDYACPAVDVKVERRVTKTCLFISGEAE
jgi:hypothetical protein